MDHHHHRHQYNHNHNHNHNHQRNLQSSSSSPPKFLYRANYTADFQHLADPSCQIDDPPVLILSCPETARNLTILGVSHASITCRRRIVNQNITLNTSYECRNTCNTTNGECQNVYVFTNVTSNGPREGPYGSIQFTCEGDQDQSQVAATFTYDDGFTGSCTAHNETRSRNYHVAKMGISCPIGNEENGEDGEDGATTIRRDYIYDDTYFECNFTGHPNASLAVFNSGSDDDSSTTSDVYTCVTGKDCLGWACADVLYRNIIITSDVSQFRQCVETTSTLVTAVPTTAPIVPLPLTSYYQAQFEALWGKLYDAAPGRTFCPSWTTPEEDPSNTTNTTNTTTLIRITCGGRNGVTAIRFHNSTDANMHCTHMNDVELLCMASDDSLVQNRFTSVIYDCFGGTLPTSTITFPETTVVCDNYDQDVRLQNTVILGLTCSPNRYYSDILFECSSPRHHFDVLVSGSYNLPGDRYSCSESNIISNRSTTSNVSMIIPSVSMTTDDFWLQNPVSQCIRVVDSIPTVIPSMTPTMTPLVVSIPSSPVVVVPIVPNAPISVNDNSSSSTVAEQNNKNGVNSSVLAVVGGIVGGIVISLIVFFVYRKGQRDGSTSSTSKYPPAASAGTSTGTDQLTGGNNSDHLTRTSGSSATNKHSSPSAATTAPSGPSSSSSSPRRRPTTVASNYVIDYKDQARSVVDPTVPVRDSARRRIEALPVAQAVPIPMNDDVTVTSPGTTHPTIPADPTSLFDV